MRFKDYALTKMKVKHYSDITLEEIYETFVTEFLLTNFLEIPKI